LAVYGHGPFHRLCSWLAELGFEAQINPYSMKNGDIKETGKIVSIQTLMNMITSFNIEESLGSESVNVVDHDYHSLSKRDQEGIESALRKMNKKVNKMPDEIVRLQEWSRQIILHVYACRNQVLRLDDERDDDDDDEEDDDNIDDSDANDSTDHVNTINNAKPFHDQSSHCHMSPRHNDPNESSPSPGKSSKKSGVSSIKTDDDHSLSSECHPFEKFFFSEKNSHMEMILYPWTQQQQEEYDASSNTKSLSSNQAQDVSRDLNMNHDSNLPKLIPFHPLRLHDPHKIHQPEVHMLSHKRKSRRSILETGITPCFASSSYDFIDLSILKERKWMMRF
jgi:hypothetical protein